MSEPTPKPGIMEIALYVSGESQLVGHSDVLKLSSNENPHGCSPAARAAFEAAAIALNRYPSTDHAGLRRAIGEVHALDPKRIICGAGSDEVLQFLTHAYAGQGDEVILTEHGFSMYPILAWMVGAVPITVPEQNRRIDVDAILQAVTEKTRLVFMANPANPTGTFLAEDALTQLAEGLPGHVILALDGAYAEFVDGYDGGVSLVDQHSNVVMTRTFSKIYGLGGLRIGWAYAQQSIIDVLNRVRQPFNLSSAQLAAAEAAIRDRDFVAFCASENARLREWLRNSLRQMGVECDASEANFVLARFDSPESAEEADRALREAGILVRRVSGYGLPEALRITIGDEPGCRRVIACLSSFMLQKREPHDADL